MDNLLHLLGRFLHWPENWAVLKEQINLGIENLANRLHDAVRVGVFVQQLNNTGNILVRQEWELPRQRLDCHVVECVRLTNILSIGGTRQMLQCTVDCLESILCAHNPLGKCFWGWDLVGSGQNLKHQELLLNTWKSLFIEMIFVGIKEAVIFIPTGARLVNPNSLRQILHYRQRYVFQSLGCLPKGGLQLAGLLRKPSSRLESLTTRHICQCPQFCCTKPQGEYILWR